MIVQFKNFKYDQEAALNAFLKTAHLYHSESMPAITFKEEFVIVRYTESPDGLPPLVAAETVYAHIRSNRELIVEDDMKVRQYKWRIEKKETRIAEIDELHKPLKAELDEIDGKQKGLKGEGKKTEEYRALQKRREEIGTEVGKLLKELNGEGPKDAGLVKQVENLKAEIEHTEKVQADRRRDIDMGLAFAAEIEGGTYEIYRQPAANA